MNKGGNMTTTTNAVRINDINGIIHKATLAKTLLTALSKVEQFLAAVDKSIIDQAQYSYRHYSNTQRTMEEIIDNIHKKKLLQDLRARTERLLELAPKKFSRVLILAYVHQLSARKIADIIKKTERTVFRHLCEGLAWFANHIDDIIDNYDFACMMSEEPWLRNIYNRLLD
jgi:DNA-directed RNA polymerase specialized sigma24 family protein